MPSSSSGAGHDRRGQARQRDPVVFETNGTVREARGVHLPHVHHAVLDGVLHVEEPTTPSRCANARVYCRISSTCGSVMRYGGSTQAESPSGCRRLDVLHDAAMTHRVPSAMASRPLEGVRGSCSIQDGVLGRHPRRRAK